jgi:hypothetical protein
MVFYAGVATTVPAFEDRLRRRKRLRNPVQIGRICSLYAGRKRPR